METKYIDTFWKTKVPCFIIDMYGSSISFTPADDNEYIPWRLVSYVDDFKLEFYRRPIELYVIIWLNNPYGVPVEQFHSCFEQVFITEEEYMKKVEDYMNGLRDGTIK